MRGRISALHPLPVQVQQFYCCGKEKDDAPESMRLARFFNSRSGRGDWKKWRSSISTMKRGPSVIDRRHRRLA